MPRRIQRDCAQTQTHASALLQEAALLWRKKELVDLTIVVKEQEFHCHKLVLVAFSSYFSNLCSGKPTEKHFLRHIQPEDLETLLEFMYTGDLKLNDDNVYLVLNGATQLQMPDAVLRCRAFLNSTGHSHLEEVENFLSDQSDGEIPADHCVPDHENDHKLLLAGQCPEPGCNFCADDQTDLSKHMKKKHGRDPHKCTSCDKNFSSFENLGRHVKKIHDRVRPYKCDECGSSFSERYDLRIHKQRHKGPKEFKCEHCNYVSNQKGNLETHLYAKHKVNKDNKAVFQCEDCSYNTIVKERFTNHVNGHKQVRPYKCPICNKGFITKKKKVPTETLR